MYVDSKAEAMSSQSPAEPSGPPRVGRPQPPHPTRPTGVAIDLQGTLVDGDGRPLPGAIATIETLKAREVPFVIASNQTSVARDRLARQLAEVGFPLTSADVLTTASLTEEHLRRKHPGARIALYADRSPFEGDDLDLRGGDEPDVVVLAGAGEWITHGSLSSILRQLRGGAVFVAMHGGHYWMDSDGLAFDTGALLPGLEAAASSRAQVIGKPSPSFFEHALASKAIAREGAVMVGDDIDSDVLAAQNLGLDRGPSSYRQVPGRPWRGQFRAS